MDGRRTDTARRIVSLGETYVMRRGYHGFSFKHIAEALDIKPAAVHYHFPTKADLVVAVLESYGRTFDRWSLAVATRPPAERLRAYFDIGRLVVADDRVCALAMITHDLATVPDEVGAAVVRIQARFLEFYARTLEEGRALGQVSFEGDAHDKATEMACAVVGAQGLARAMGPHTYDRVVHQLGRSLAMA